jgi:hypothetical protein
MGKKKGKKKGIQASTLETKQSHACIVCKREFNSEASLNQHFADQHAFGCGYWNRAFRTEEALKQHTKSKHSRICDFCSQEFYSGDDLEEHVSNEHPFGYHCSSDLSELKSWLHKHLEDEHPFGCDDCDLDFDSEEALEQHRSSKHRYEPDVFDGVPFPGADGEWVYREDFEGRKGFGLFVCRSCSRSWMSAHAFRQKFGQDCKKCGLKSLFADIMWQSYSYGDHCQNNLDNDRPAHDAARCDACKSGYYCTNRS